MPVICDPGFELVQACRAEGIYVTVLPGASALLMALVLSGIPPHPFAFFGYVPTKQSERSAFFQKAATFEGTTLCYETPHRLLKTLAYLQEQFAEATVAVARELTKAFEEVRYGTPQDVLDHFTQHPPLGEIVLVMRFPPPQAPDLEMLLKPLLTHLSVKEASAQVAAQTGLHKREVYQTALRLKEQGESK
jgi:16S rRNA (cytidine1402-2'-O)-methyltransferase